MAEGDQNKDCQVEASREEKCPMCESPERDELWGLSNGLNRDRWKACPDPWHKGSATAQTPEIVIERCQFGAWEREHHPEADDREHLEYERVSTGLSSGICAYGYIERKGQLFAG